MCTVVHSSDHSTVVKENKKLLPGGRDYSTQSFKNSGEMVSIFCPSPTGTDIAFT